MSIINEALKKTEEHLQKNSAQDSSLAHKPSGPKPFLLYILILLTGILISNFIFTLLKRRVQTVQVPVENSSPITRALNSVPAPVLPSQQAQEKKQAETNFVLNGIFFSDDAGYALVNNQIVRENDYVDGAKVGSITANIVQLDNAGKIITLTSGR